MPDKFSGNEREFFTLTCPVCGNPLESGDHSECSSDEYDELSKRAHKNIEALTPEERERISKAGHHFLDVQENSYLAGKTFNSVQDFEGLRKTADKLLRERPDSYDLAILLTLLEDHEGMRNLLNSEAKESNLEHDHAFDILDRALRSRIQEFLHANNTPVATGGVNKGVDLVAIRNLARQYEVAVPIARGGLNQGAIASLWGMSTRIADIAAHGRKVAIGKWVNPVAKEDIAGKNVLLFDKDAVTGASIQHAVKMVSRFKPKSIGVYFLHAPVPRGRVGVGTNLEGLPAGIKIFHPNNAPLENAGDAYIEAHEKLGTLYGRRRLMKQLYLTEIIPQLEKQYPVLAKPTVEFLNNQLKTFDSFNPYLAGVEETRERILAKLQKLAGEARDYLKNDLFELPGAVERFQQILISIMEERVDLTDIITERYKKRANEAATQRGIENPHNPSFPLGAFHAAQAAAKKAYDVVVIVGPEGFAYEPYFKDLGLRTVAVNIPESQEGGVRTIKQFEDLSVLRGKKVLVVEDDVRSGATLQKLLETLEPNKPALLGLYLGQPESFHKLENIPKDFQDTYMATQPHNDAELNIAAKEFQAHLASKGLKIFK